MEKEDKSKKKEIPPERRNQFTLKGFMNIFREKPQTESDKEKEKKK